MENSMSKIKIGLSGAASWAWGTSLIMGQQIAQERGIVAWIIWAVCNTLTMALFGWLFNKGFIKKDIYESMFVKVIAIVIQLFCLLVQLNFINQQLSIISGSEKIGMVGTMAIGVVFVLIVFRHGLRISVLTDVFQWLIASVAIFVILGVAIYTKCQFADFVPTTGSGVMWGVWSGLILFAGPIGDVQHWQRAEADISKKGYYYAALFFGIYMLQILGMAFFQFNQIMNIILLVAVLCVTTSTIDSISVALHKIGNKYIGTCVAICICISFPVFVKMGMLDLWSSFGVIRYAFAIMILLAPLAKLKKISITLPVVIVAVAIAVYFAITGQIVANSVAGIISLACAGVIFAKVIFDTINSKQEIKEQ